MLLRVFGSGSKGNGYALTGKNGTLLIECGLPFMEVAKQMNYRMSDVIGVIVSHEHG